MVNNKGNQGNRLISFNKDIFHIILSKWSNLLKLRKVGKMMFFIKKSEFLRIMPYFVHDGSPNVNLTLPF